MIEYVLILWLTAIPEGEAAYVTIPTEIGTYHQLDRCEDARDKLIEMTDAKKGAVVAVCVARDK
jgi:hypothetical protein